VVRLNARKVRSKTRVQKERREDCGSPAVALLAFREGCGSDGAVDFLHGQSYTDLSRIRQRECILTRLAEGSKVLLHHEKSSRVP
jgi:hypothetical protein